MRSSISSSESLASGSGWIVTWLTAVVIAALAIVGSELFWRGRGHRPAIANDLDLWALQRDRVSRAGSRGIALVGASRIQAAIDIQTLQSEVPGHVVAQLAVGGSSPVPVLVDLAEDRHFRGLVICDITESQMAFQHESVQQDYVDHYRRRGNGWDARLDRRIGLGRQQLMVVGQPELSPASLLSRWLLDGELPRPSAASLREDRSRPVDFSRVDLQKRLEFQRDLVARHSGPISMSTSGFLDRLSPIEAMVKRIQDRGGRVVLVYFPITGIRLHSNEQRFPRAEYWGAFASSTEAATLHFQDVPAMREFECPDYSHIDVQDTVAFTRILVDQLRHLGALPKSNRLSNSYR